MANTKSKAVPKKHKKPVPAKSRKPIKGKPAKKLVKQPDKQPTKVPDKVTTEDKMPRFRKTSKGVKVATSFQTPTHVDDYKVSIAEKFRSCGSYFKGRHTPRKAPSVKLTRAICNLIRIGSHPVTAARAIGIIPDQFWHWFNLGVDDIKQGVHSPFSAFCTALDAAAAQDEIIDISLISQRVNNWQALAWKLERKNRGRWGARVEDGNGDESRPASKVEEPKQFSANKIGEIAAILESVGALDGPTNPMKKIPVVNKKANSKKPIIDIKESSPVEDAVAVAEASLPEYPEYD